MGIVINDRVLVVADEDPEYHRVHFRPTAASISWEWVADCCSEEVALMLAHALLHHLPDDSSTIN